MPQKKPIKCNVNHLSLIDVCKGIANFENQIKFLKNLSRDTASLYFYEMRMTIFCIPSLFFSIDLQFPKESISFRKATYKEGYNDPGSNISDLLGECEMKAGVYHRLGLNWAW